MPARVRCAWCEEYWPAGSRFCGRCGRPIGPDAPADRDAPGRPARNRRRLFAIVVAVAAVVLIAVLLLSGGDPEPTPDMPLDPTLSAAAPLPDGQASVRLNRLDAG